MRRFASRCREGAALLFAVAACTSKGTVIVQPESTTLSLFPASGAVVQGGSTRTLATVVRRSDLTGDISLSVTGGYSDITAAVSELHTSGDRTTGTITIAIETATALGPYALTVHATGSGISELTATYTLNVTPAPPSYTMALSSAMLFSVQGAATATTTITLARINFPGQVTLSVDNLPSGVTASFTPPSPIAGNTSVLTLTVAGNAPVGTFTNLAVRGVTQSLFNLPDVTVPLALSITVAGSSVRD